MKMPRRSVLVESIMVISFLCLFIFPFNSRAQSDPTDYFRSNGIVQGLDEIRQEALKFVSEDNASRHTHWIVTAPNLKVLVPRCAVPLAAAWAAKSYGLSVKSVSVICAQTMPGGTWVKNWHVFVPVAAGHGTLTQKAYTSDLDH